MLTDTDAKISKVLILELGGIGDVILSIPAVLAIRERFTEADITVLTVPRSGPVLERIDRRDREMETVRKKGFELETFQLQNGMPLSRETFTLFPSLRQRCFDILIDLSAIESRMANLKRELLIRSVGACSSVGRGTDGRGSFFSKRTAEILASSQHEMDRKLDVAALLSARSTLGAPIFPVLEHEYDEAGLFLEENRIHPGRVLTAVHPGGMTAGKRWPVQRFTKAVKWLTDNLGAMVLIIGGPGTAPLVEEICSSAGNASVIPVISQPLGAVAALLDRCSLFLTNDSGPMHLAATLGVPTVAIFGQTNHPRYFPLLPESRRELTFADPSLCVNGWKGDEHEECRDTDCRRPECLNAVTVDEVISMMESLCSRTGMLYNTHLAMTPEDESEAQETLSQEKVAKEDAGYITRRARELSAGLVKDGGGPILDVACGKGYLLSDLADDDKVTADLWGLDISMDQLGAASTRLWRRPGEQPAGTPRLIRGDLTSLPFRTGSFSSSLCVNTLLNLNGNGGLTKYLTEVARVTKPGGKVLVEARNPFNPLVVMRFLFGKLFRGVPLNFHRLEDVVSAGTETGLSLKSREPVGSVGGFLGYSYILVFRKEDGVC